MRVYPSSYSALGLSQAEFIDTCKRVADHLPDFMRRFHATHAVVRGSSGLSVAFGLRMISDVKIAVARKPGENSHGSAISAVGSGSEELSRYVILDDFVSTGATVAGIIRDLHGAECVGLFLYNGACVDVGPPYVDTYRGLNSSYSIPQLRFRSY